MKYLTVTIRDIDRLNAIQTKLSESQPLTVEDQIYLSKFLTQLPATKTLLVDTIPIDAVISVQLWDMDYLENSLEYWKELFDNIPGYDYVGSYVEEGIEKELRKRGVIMLVDFAPSYSYNMANNDGYYINLKDDGMAVFQLPTLEDAEQYPELYNFKGSWKEAYLLLVETLKKGWPMEEFPEELKPFLKK